MYINDFAGDVVLPKGPAYRSGSPIDRLLGTRALTPPFASLLAQVRSRVRCCLAGGGSWSRQPSLGESTPLPTHSPAGTTAIQWQAGPNAGATEGGPRRLAPTTILKPDSPATLHFSGCRYP